MLTIRAALLIDAPTLLELMTPFNAFEGIPFTKEKVAVQSPEYFCRR